MIKCTQDIVPRTEILRFKMRGSVFELIGKESPVLPNGGLPMSAKALPEAAVAIIPPTSYLEVPAAAEEIAVPEPEGDSVLQVKVAKGKAEASNFDDNRNDMLCQTLKSPLLMITNPTDTRIAITEYWVEFKEGEEWKKSPSRVGVNSMDYYGRSYTQFVDTQSFEIESHASLELIFEGTMSIPKDGHVAYNGRPHNQRIHNAFPSPLHARVHVKDDSDKVKTMYFSYQNEALDHLWLTYDDAVKACGNQEGFGETYNCEMWICVENPLDLNKCIIMVATLKENPHDWYVRVQSDRRDIGGSYNAGGPAHFKKIGFKASLDAEKPAEVSKLLLCC